jgi:hypothetical protein
MGTVAVAVGPFEEHRQDPWRPAAAQADPLATGVHGRHERCGQRDPLPVEHHREAERHGVRFRGQSQRELESKVVVAVQDDPPGADLVEGEGARLHRADQDLVDHA